MMETQSRLPIIKLPSSDAAELVEELEQQSFFGIYPRARDFKELLPQTIAFADIGQMRTQERSDRPERQMSIYQTVLANLPRDRRNSRMVEPKAKGVLDRNYYFVSQKDPYTCFDRSEVYVHDQVAADLESKDTLTRFTGSVNLGLRLIDGNIRALAYGLNPNPIPMAEEFLWLPMFHSQVDNLYQAMEKVLDGKDRTRFRRSKPEVMQYFSKKGLSRDNTHLVAVGVQVLYHKLDQPLTMAEYTLGTSFDKGIVEVLASPVKMQFLLMLGERLGINVTDNGVPPRIQADDLRICQILELEGQALFDAYINSQVPQLYMDSDDPELNPFKYPQLINPGFWL